ncbi:MAG: flagellar basal body P-ring protein FlgI [Planctomycetes bacterium]|nr:flagellar basal body P-ring protein FlgI [Planctomycetota bacterium]
MNPRFPSLLGAILLLAGLLPAQARIAEIADLEGVRDNYIKGIGLVVGLNGTGDGTDITKRMLANMLTRNNVNATPQDVDSKNAAVVMVTARLSPFKRPGSRLDVDVACINNATNLSGGTLIETYLYGPDQQTVYAIAQGPVSTPTKKAEGQSGSSVVVAHPTVASIPSGALIEKSVEMQIHNNRNVVTFNLRNQNFNTASNVARAIEAKYPGTAHAVDAGMIEVKIPDAWMTRITEFIASIQEIRVEVDMVSKIVVNRKTGVIIAGQDVRISKVAVAQGSISVTIEENPIPVTAAPFTEGPSIAAVPRSEVQITEENRGLKVVDGGESVASLAASLNALGVAPSELISILETIKAAGALHAELEVR